MTRESEETTEGEVDVRHKISGNIVIKLRPNKITIESIQSSV